METENKRCRDCSKPHVSVITLNVSGLSSPIRRKRVAGWIKELRPQSILPSGDTSWYKDKHRLHVNE